MDNNVLIFRQYPKVKYQKRKICPKPKNMNDKIAANPSFFLSTYGDGGGTGGYGTGATLTPHVGQNSALALIIPPQLTQNLLSFSYEDPVCSKSDNT
jgi:hypothetical protein